MFKTGLRQLRMAWSASLGKPFNVRNLELLIADAQATLAEFGTPGDDLATFLDGPFSDPRARHEMQNYALQRTVHNLLRHSPS